MNSTSNILNYKTLRLLDRCILIKNIHFTDPLVLSLVNIKQLIKIFYFFNEIKNILIYLIKLTNIIDKNQVNKIYIKYLSINITFYIKN